MSKGKLQPDLIIIVAHRDEVEAGDIHRVLGIFEELVKPERMMMSYESVEFCVSGWDDDPRELCEIPECRVWMKRLDQKFSYWLWILCPLTQALEFVMFSLCPVHKRKEGLCVHPDDLSRFLAEKFMAVNVLLESSGIIAEEHSRQLSEDVRKYFEKRFR